MKLKVIFIEILICLSLLGCTQIDEKKIIEMRNKTEININDMKTAFLSAGLLIKETSEDIDKDLTLNGVEPVVFTINYNRPKHRIFVYEVAIIEGDAFVATGKGREIQIPKETDIFKMNIKWNDKEEEIELRCKATLAKPASETGL